MTAPLTDYAALAERLEAAAKKLSALASIQPANFAIVSDLTTVEWLCRKAAAAIRTMAGPTEEDIDRGCAHAAERVAIIKAKSALPAAEYDTGHEYRWPSAETPVPALSLEQITTIMPHPSWADGEYLPTRFTAGQLRDLCGMAMRPLDPYVKGLERDAAKWREYEQAHRAFGDTDGKE